MSEILLLSKYYRVGLTLVGNTKKTSIGNDKQITLIKLFIFLVADMPGAVRFVRTCNHGEVRHEGRADRPAAAGARATARAALPRPGARMGAAGSGHTGP